MNIKRPTLLGAALVRFVRLSCSSAGRSGWSWRALLAVQLWVATHRELALPDFALRAIERRLAASRSHGPFRPGGV